MLADLTFFANDNKMVAGLGAAQSSLKTHDAYKMQPSAYSGMQDVIFYDHFMLVFRAALSSDNPCNLAAMSKKELETYYRFLDFENGMYMYGDKSKDGLDIVCPTDPYADVVFCNVGETGCCTYVYAELDMVVQQLDNCLMDELACEATCSVNSGYNECDVNHTWNTCSK